MGWYTSLGEASRAWAMFCIVCIVLAILVMGSLVIEKWTDFDHTHDHTHAAHHHPHEHKAHKHPHPWPEHTHGLEGRAE